MVQGRMARNMTGVPQWFVVRGRSPEFDPLPIKTENQWARRGLHERWWWNWRGGPLLQDMVPE